MSFLPKTILTTTRVTVAPSYRTYRSFSITLAAKKGPVEGTKDALKKVDRTVSDAAVKGIETGEKATKKVQETVGTKGHEAAAKAKEVAGEAKAKGSELKDQANGKA
ncbi:LEA domain protein [Talaromyces proteolyticus]|uniref:LEA domain protein n=1 Tax=Talaromyces proteolyticus TaxID=1131652 RepID=A0AAD4KKX8_9EURO|nr:LEA domain protein [Talaromyces proteolyticus]KAH8692637.1 LEA domain protein [Talaromyces proteolyticus]